MAYSISRPKRFVYLPGEGLYFEIYVKDHALDGPDNDFDVTFHLENEALRKLAGRTIAEADDAKSVAQKYQAQIAAAIAGLVARRGLSSPGDRSRAICCDDVRAP